MPTPLTKSLFTTARDCPTKLHYRAHRYPTTTKGQEFMELLAEGGLVVGRMAQLLFPEGVLVAGGGNIGTALAHTHDLMQQDTVTLFEPVFEIGGMHVRADVLVKHGTHLKLIEVKAKSYDSILGPEQFWNTYDEIKSGWVKYIDDVGFQTMVLQRCYPDYGITPYLMLCDKEKRARMDHLLQQFVLHEDKSVEFTGDVERLREEDFLAQVLVRAEVDHRMPEIEGAAAGYVAALQADARIAPTLASKCKKCEYRLVGDELPNGFTECWGKMAHAQPHLLELNNLGSIKHDGVKAGEQLFAAGQASLFDMPLDWLGAKVQGQGQKRQIECAHTGQEWHSDELQNVLAGHAYPLHFIDFETAKPPLPYHAGMAPYGQIAFQWSCHSVSAPGAAPVHSEWLNPGDSCPNAEFVRTLKEQIGDTGTVFMWTHHEKTVLGQIQRELDTELQEWIAWLRPTMVDQYAISKQHYYHPDMQGSHSIKCVLPAIWCNNPALHALPYFADYYQECAGVVADPYDTLRATPLPRSTEIDRAAVQFWTEQDDDTVKDGTGAMLAYQQMMYALYQGDPTTHARWRDLLLQYCKLDTLAMVMIYWHWRGIKE